MPPLCSLNCGARSRMGPSDGTVLDASVASFLSHGRDRYRLATDASIPFVQESLLQGIK